MNSTVEALLTEYGLGDRNQSIGSGKGGNISKFGFLLSKNHIEDNTKTYTVDIVNNDMIWNTEWLGQASFRQIRDEVDSKIEALNINFPDKSADLFVQLGIDPQTISSKVRDMNVLAVLQGSQEVDISNLSEKDKLIFARLLAKEFADQADAVNACPGKEICANFTNILNKLNTGIVVFAIRTQIGIDRMVKFNIDEEPSMYDILLKISSFPK